MNHLLDDDDDLQARGNEREITLSTSAVLGIFFGLALLCALFFGFGYNMGRKSARPAIASTDNYGNPVSPINSSAAKPAAGSPTATTPADGNPSAPPTAATDSASGSVAPPATASTTFAQPETAPPPAAQPPASAPIVLSHPTPTPAATGTALAPGSFVVQIAAVSHQEDADLLVNALQQRGYSVTARPEPDKLIHIQVGPFSNRNDANAMRQRLLADGYNALVK